MDNYLVPSLIERFVNFLKTQNKSGFTIIAYKKDLEQFAGFLSTREKGDVREIKKEDIEAFINKLLGESYTKKSASRKLNSIRTFFRFLKNEGIIEQNPSLDVSHPKYMQSPPRIFSKLEYRALRDVAKEDLRTYALVEILLQTGIKIGEVANLRLSDIKEGSLFIREYGKSLERETPLNKAVKKAITDYLRVMKEVASLIKKAVPGQTGSSSYSAADQKDSPLFITRTGKALLVRNIRQIITRCFREVGIENATVNDLRNTFIAHQLKSGVPIEYVAKVAGHKRLSSTERFLSLVKEGAEKKERLGEL